MTIAPAKPATYADALYRLGRGEELLGEELLALPDFGKPFGIVGPMGYCLEEVPEVILKAAELAVEHGVDRADEAMDAALTLFHEIKEAGYPVPQPTIRVIVSALWFIGSSADLAIRLRGFETCRAPT